MDGNIFSEDWYKVSELNIGLLYTIDIHKQYHRGRLWYVIHEKYNNKYFRITPESYKFLMVLTPKKTVNEVWENYLEKFPEITPSQDELIQLLSQLHQFNILFYKNRPKNEHIFDRHVKKKKSELKNKFISFMYIKIPLFDPEEYLEKFKELIGLIFNIKTLVIWFIVVLFGIKTFFENYHNFSSESEGMLSPSNIIYLYISLVILKILHEFGHSMMTKKFGGEVHAMGVMFIIFTPLPYMDASSSWSFRNKWHRVFVGFAGMLVELFVAAIAAIIWANTGAGLVHALAFNMMVIGSVSSLLFNGNPLLKFDSYYMLSDYLEIPNLQKRSKDIFYYIAEKYIFKIESSFAYFTTVKENILLMLYGISSLMYRFFVTLVIAMFVSDEFFAIGVIVVLMSVYMWILKPFYTFIKYLFTSSKLYKNRKYAVSISSLFGGLIVILICFIPFPDSIRASGVVQSDKFINVFIPTEGVLKNIYVKNGQYVKKGELLFELENDELPIKIKLLNAQLKEMKSYQLKSRNESISDLKPIEKRISLLKDSLNHTKQKIMDLKVYSKSEGVLVTNNIVKLKNSWLKVSEKVGSIVPKENYKFIAVVSQEKASSLFNLDISNANIKIKGNYDKNIEITNIKVIPYEKHQLPSPALGWLGGGEIDVSRSDSSGLTAKEAFFEVHVTLANSNHSELLLYNRVGTLRINLPKKTILNQSLEFINQLLQKRYKI